jgi:hypothetical protein
MKELTIHDIVATLIQQARAVTDLGDEVQAVLQDGDTHFNEADARRILKRAVDAVKKAATERLDSATLKLLEGSTEVVVDRLIRARRTTAPVSMVPAVSVGGANRPAVMQLEFNGISASPVKPTPVFHGREVAMRGGFVRTREVAQWDKNLRLQIHLGQFEHENGRPPNSDEVLDIMLGKLKLPGLEENDHFEIESLARSIAINGVQKPPILDTDGTLLDGNRRVAACQLILGSSEFTSEQKKRAEHVYVWQLTEFATEEDRRLVVVALNFEPDCKQNWPEYVKAKKVTEEWRAMLDREPTPPGPQRQAIMKRELSIRFALGPETRVVSRYIKMVEWAEMFEDHLINGRHEDEHVVQHRANKYFQYFDELSKNESDGVAYVLKNDEGFRHMVFDLLFQGKFKNWRQIRELRFINENEEAKALLRKAREAKIEDEDEWEECIDNAIAIARSRRAEARMLGANTRIESFVSWLEDLPVKAFRDEIKPENLRGLLKALKLVEKHAAAVLGKAA